MYSIDRYEDISKHSDGPNYVVNSCGPCDIGLESAGELETEIKENPFDSLPASKNGLVFIVNLKTGRIITKNKNTGEILH